MKADALLAADGLDARVDEEDNGADGDEDGEQGGEGEAVDESLAAACYAGVERFGDGGFFTGNGIGGVKNYGRVIMEVVYVYSLEVCEWVGGGDASRVVWRGAVVDDVSI